MSEERNWDDVFEEIIDDPDLYIGKFYEDKHAKLGPPIAEGRTLLEAIEEYKRMRAEEDYPYE